jgi:hypothetical protein
VVVVVVAVVEVELVEVGWVEVVGTEDGEICDDVVVDGSRAEVQPTSNSNDAAASRPDRIIMDERYSPIPVGAAPIRSRVLLRMHEQEEARALLRKGRDMRMARTLLLVLGLIIAAVPSAMAAHDTNPSEPVRSYTYLLGSVADNAPGASGTVRLTALPNGKIQVKIRAEGLAPNLPHAQHLHGILDETSDRFVVGACPTIARDQNGDGLVDTLEGVGDYGLVRQSLTTTGDTSPSSALAVDRFPVADDSGSLRYTRTFTPTDPRVWEGLGALEVVIHGVDLNSSGGYDFEAGVSPLNPALPLEATLPALCGGPQG